MRILLVNPNTTVAMTDDMVAAASVVVPDVEVVGVTARRGVAAIDGYRDDVVAAAAAVEAMGEQTTGYDGVILGCYGEPGLNAIRELSTGPVVGIAEASFLTAMMLGHRFSVLTTLARGIPPIEDRLRLHGVESRCVSVRATGLTVLEAHRDREAALGGLEREGRLAVDQDRAEVLCLGCGGLLGLRESLEERLAVPVVEAVPAAAVVVRGLVVNGLRTSKAGAYKFPEPGEARGTRA